MTIFYAYEQTDLTSYNLFFWYDNLDFEEFNELPSPPGFDDNYHLYTDTNDSLSLYGSGFAYDLSHQMTTGTIEAISQWAWVPDQTLQNEGYWSERWYWSGLEYDMQDFWNAGATPSLADDFAFLKDALSGNDTFHLSNQDDRVRGFDGDDRMNGNAGNDVLNGNKGADDLVGGTGRDELYGDRGKDRLEGKRGNDTLDGGNGADTLRGGEGRDEITGGGKEDRFVFRNGDEKDILMDFDAFGSNHDVLDLSRLSSIRNFNDLMNNHISENNGNVLIDGGNGDLIKLVGVDLDHIDAGDFIF